MAEENNTNEENFSDDPIENLRMENELMKLRLQAQFGATMGTEQNLPPEIENEFLKNVIAFEQNHGEYTPVKVIDYLGKPDFPKLSSLDTESLKREYDRLIELMDKKLLAVDFIRPRDDRFKYEFITEELFDHEMDSNALPGMTTNFIYEEFHPDHEMDINNRAEDFLRNWFRKEFNEYSFELNSEFILADGRRLSREDVIVKIQHLFDCFSSFTNCKVAMHEVKFEWNDETQMGLGHAEGAVKYDAVLPSGETMSMEGPFKLYLSNDDRWWSIFYFVFPGFEW